MQTFSVIMVTLVVLTCLTCSSRSHILLQHPVETYRYYIEYVCPVFITGKPQGFFEPSRVCYEIGEQGPCALGQIVAFKHATNEATCFRQSQPNSIQNRVNSTSPYSFPANIGINSCRPGEVFNPEMQTCAETRSVTEID